MRLLKHRWSKRTEVAWRNRQEIIAAGLTRRDLLKLGLLTGTGYLVAKSGLSVRAGSAPVSPPTRPFVEPLPMLTVKKPVSVLMPEPTIDPLASEGRTRSHQACIKVPDKFSLAASTLYEIHQKAATVSVHPNLPDQTLWGFDGKVPGPVYHARYGRPILVRNHNDLPEDNGGFGMPEPSTHLHNAHTPSESDGFPGDFMRRGQHYDHYYPNALAGFDSTHKQEGGDINESLGTLWYHDHRLDFTAQNVYKGLAGFYTLYNDFDTGDETTGFRLPGVPTGDLHDPIDYDIPLMLADQVYDQDGQLFYDLFNLDGIIGDKFLVNGKIQPYFEVKPRRYRFRMLNIGPSRFQRLFLTDRGTNTAMPFWQISSDGNLLPKPIKVKSITLAVAERIDIIIDFRPLAGKTLYFENRLEQRSGRGPTGKLFPAGQGNFILQFKVGTAPVADNSKDPSLITTYKLPNKTETPRITRTFMFDRFNSMWTINGQVVDLASPRLRVRQNSTEKWVFINDSGGWEHPIHVHFEEFQILSRNGRIPPAVERGRKDVLRLKRHERVEILMRFRDFEGHYVMHCHNVVHEDHAMMLRYDIDADGDA